MEMKTDWDLTPLLEDESDEVLAQKLDEIRAAHDAFTEKWAGRDDYLTDADVLKEALDDLERLEREQGLSGDPGFYYSLKHSVDQANPSVLARVNKLEEFENAERNKLRFFTLKLAKVNEAKQKEFLENEGLGEYRHFLETIFQRSKHLLSEGEERIMTMKAPMAHDYWERMTQGLVTKQEREITINGETRKANFSELLNMVEDRDEKVREVAAIALNEILSMYSEVAEAEMNAILANKKVNDELRNYSRPDASRHLDDDISAEVVDTLIETVAKKYDISRRFFALKAKLLGVDKINYYERAVPYGGSDVSYEFEDAVKMVMKTFRRLDAEFAEIFERFLSNGQVDAFPKKGKRNGAFCSHNLQRQPTYIMLNHSGSLKNVTTIAHEMGHGINAELMNRTQNALNIGTPKSTAEVASTFMEDFVLEDLMKEANDDQKLAILIESLDRDVATIFRQTAFYRFEWELHNTFREKGYLSAREIGEMFVRHMHEYMGDAVDTREADNWWVYIPHFRYLFYVYSYASGILVAKGLQAKYREDNSFIGEVKRFLSAGTSASPRDILLSLGIDITKDEFWLEGLGEMEKTLNEAEKLAERLGKI